MSERQPRAKILVRIFPANGVPVRFVVDPDYPALVCIWDAFQAGGARTRNKRKNFSLPDRVCQSVRLEGNSGGNGQEGKGMLCMNREGLRDYLRLFQSAHPHAQAFVRWASEILEFFEVSRQEDDSPQEVDPLEQEFETTLLPADPEPEPDYTLVAGLPAQPSPQSWPEILFGVNVSVDPECPWRFSATELYALAGSPQNQTPYDYKRRVDAVAIGVEIAREFHGAKVSLEPGENRFDPAFLETLGIVRSVKGGQSGGGVTYFEANFLLEYAGAINPSFRLRVNKGYEKWQLQQAGIERTPAAPAPVPPSAYAEEIWAILKGEAQAISNIKGQVAGHDQRLEKAEAEAKALREELAKAQADAKQALDTVSGETHFRSLAAWASRRGVHLARKEAGYESRCYAAPLCRKMDLTRKQIGSERDDVIWAYPVQVLEAWLVNYVSRHRWLEIGTDGMVRPRQHKPDPPPAPLP